MEFIFNLHTASYFSSTQQVILLKFIYEMKQTSGPVVYTCTTNAFQGLIHRQEQETRKQVKESALN